MPTDLDTLAALAREADPMTHVTIPTAALTELRAQVEKAEADAAHWMAVADPNLVSWTKQSVRAWGHELTRESLTELLAAADECADGTTQMVWDKFGRMVPYPDRAADAERALTPVRRLRAAVARVRGE